MVAAFKAKLKSGNIKKNFEALRKKYPTVGAMVGVLDTSSESDGITDVEKAAYNSVDHIVDNGNAKIFVPGRDYRKKCIDDNGQKYSKMVLSATRSEDTQKGFRRVGIVAQQDMKKGIVGITPKNAPSTIESKGKDSPLRNTLSLLNAQKYKLLKEKELDEMLEEQ